MRAWWSTTGLLTLFTLGCGFMGNDDGADDPVEDGPTLDPTTEDNAAAPPSTLGEVRPVFQTVGDEGSAPRRLTIRFGRDVVDADAVGPLEEGAAPVMEPAVAGAWSWASPSRLTFEPAEGFAPETTYTAKLEKLPSKWGELAGPAVSHTFEVPALQVTRVRRAMMDSRFVDIDVQFSGPVDPSTADRVSLTVGPKLLERAVVPSGRADRLRFRVDRKRLGEKQVEVGVRVQEGVRSAVVASATAPASRQTLKLDTRVRPMEIRNVKLREADDGYYLQVYCHDQAVGDPDYWWDRVDYDSYELSERCVLSADSVGSLRFTPDVANVYVAEGQRGFRIFGDFQPGDLKLVVEEGATTEAGGTLQKAYTAEFTVDTRTPRVEMVAKQGRYLPRKAWGNLPIRHLNTDEVEVSIRHVPAQNLVYWLSDDDESADARTSDLVAKKSIPVKNPTDTLESSWIDVAALVEGEKDGLFEIRVEPDTGGKGDVSRVVLTDLHLVAKQPATAPGADWPDRVHVWALDADRSNGVAGVVVDAVRPSGFVMATCRTGLDGACDLVMPADDVIDDTPPVALIARKGDDLTYLRFADLETPVSEDDVAGLSWSADSPYTASLYGDRGVYRPGDTVHLGLVVRTADHIAPEAGLPATLTIVDPRRKEVETEALTLDANGMASFDLPLASFAPTGSWRATLSIGDVEVDTLPFSVEEFVPERMEVEATLRGDGLLATDTATVDVEARYLFGGSAEGSPVEVTCSIVPRAFKPANNNNFHYGAVFVGGDTAPRQMSVSSQKGTLDADGTLATKCGGASAGFPVSGRLQADVAVFEGGSGRSSRALASVPVHPETFYIGLDSGADEVASGDEVDVSGILVDWEGASTAAGQEVEVVFYRLEEEYGWWWWDGRGEESYDLYLRRAEEARTTVTAGADGRFSASFTARADGAGYLVRATAGNARTDLRLQGAKRRYHWSSDSQVDRTPRPAKPTSLAVKLPSTLTVGAETRATVVAPYDGRMLFTMETDRLLANEWVDVKAGPVEWTFTVPGFVPNVYVSAFLVKDPHVDSPEGYTPERAFGVSSVRVDPVDHALTVAVTAPDEVRSNSALPVTIDLGAAGANATVTVAAVDEGILQLTDFETPDPLADIFAQRRLGVRTFETVGWSMLMPAGPSSTHGGDGMGAGGRVQQVKPVALWSGPLTADASGKATVTLDVPQYRGKLRVMAVAASGERMGSGEIPVLVRDPLVLQTTLPRFLVQGDTFQIPVFVTNLSGADQDVEITLGVEDLPWPGMAADPGRPAPVALLGADRAKVRIRDGESKTVAFQGRAEALVGAATFKVQVSGGGHTSYETLDVPFAPAAPRERTMEQVTLAAGALDLGPQLDGWLPTTETTSLWVTPNPYGQAMGHLKHLVRYPYGCIEQTTSSTRPLLFVRDLVPGVVPELQGEALDEMVEHGIDRVLAMQTPSGGFGYWPGARSPSAWGTVYATHMLMDAQKQQYDVPQERLDEALAYLETIVRQAATNDTAFSRYRNDEPYAHYVLALAGKPQKARAQKLLAGLGSDPSGQDAENAYLLKAALFKAGDRTHEAALKAPDASKLTGVRKNSWSFYSDLRRRGMMLSVYHDLFGPGESGAGDLARLVARGLEGQKSAHYTTQELVWGVTGLGKRVAAGSRDFSGIELLEDGKPVARIPAKKGDAEPRWAIPRASERDLTLKVGDAGSGKLYLVVNSEGVKAGAELKTGGSGLSLTRTYHDPDGKPVKLDDVQLGDVVYTKVLVKNTTRDSIQNIALVDRFVSGWEIENPRLGRGGAADWVQTDQLWEADHMNLRDDRLELFGTLDAGQSRQVVYALRAVTAGTFTSPPVEAEAMYDPSVWARQPGETVVVKGPWDDVLL
jgi:hypothetical protein